MTDWVETYFPTEPVRKQGFLRRTLPALVFTAVLAGSLFVSLKDAPLRQTAFGGGKFAGVDIVNALDFNNIEPASGAGDADRIGKETSNQSTAPSQSSQAQAAPEFIAPAAGAVVQNGEHQVQAVLVAKSLAVVSSTMDARIQKMPFNNGETFEKGDVLVEYDCGGDVARLREVQARQRLSQSQLDAYKALKDMQVVSKIEYVTAVENNAQAQAQIAQMNSRLTMCKIKAPFPGRVVNKTASQHEFVQTGRVLMEIVSREPLQAEFLIPSLWLRWLNVGTPLQVYINESDKTYNARISRIHGEVDPVSQSVQVDAEIESYSEVLLPGMSGKATFAPETVYKKPGFGFMGMMLPDEENGGVKQP